MHSCVVIMSPARARTVAEKSSASAAFVLAAWLLRVTARKAAPALSPLHRPSQPEAVLREVCAWPGKEVATVSRKGARAVSSLSFIWAAAALSWAPLHQE